MIFFIANGQRTVFLQCIQDDIVTFYLQIFSQKAQYSEVQTSLRRNRCFFFNICSCFRWNSKNYAMIIDKTNRKRKIEQIYIVSQLNFCGHIWINNTYRFHIISDKNGRFIIILHVKKSLLVNALKSRLMWRHGVITQRHLPELVFWTAKLISNMYIMC